MPYTVSVPNNNNISINHFIFKIVICSYIPIIFCNDLYIHLNFVYNNIIYSVLYLIHNIYIDIIHQTQSYNYINTSK